MPRPARATSRRALNGIAHLFEHMVFKGAGGRSAREISELVEDVGGDLNASTDRELTAFYVSLLAPDLELGVKLLADLIQRPHFEQPHLELEKKVVLQELAEANDTASDMVFDLLQEAAFGGQPLGRSVLGDGESIRADHGGRSPRLAATAICAELAGPGRRRQARA